MEPADSPARAYLLVAAFLHAPRGSALAKAFKSELRRYLANGQANEQFEAAIVIGLHGSATDLPALATLLKSDRADARIGAADAMLHLIS